MELIPFNRPVIVGREFEYIREAIQQLHISGNGSFTKRCCALLEELTGSRRAFLTTSCTDALEMTALLLNIQSGDEVVVPSFTFVSTANAFALHGARPVFADIREDTLNLDERLLEGNLTSRTKAVVPVHYAGIGCEMEAIVKLTRPRGIAVVEDAAHGLFAKLDGRPLGSFGDLATLSFHETKNVMCGEGGALLLNQEHLIERAEILHEKGTNRASFYRGQVDRYSWVDLGSSFLPSDMLAAFLLAQLEARDHIQGVRRTAWQYYQTHLEDWARARGFRLPLVPERCEQPYHMFYLLLPGLADRTAFLAHLKKRQVTACFHYVPLHLSEMGQRFGGRPGMCPVAENVSDRLVRLPLFNDLGEELLSRIVAAVKEF